MDLGEAPLSTVPQHLSKLNKVEEILIVRAQVHVEAKWIRGHQYQCA